MGIDNDKEIHVTLTVGKLNVILDALSQRPFKDVAGIISEVHQQVTPQLVPQQTAESVD